MRHVPYWSEPDIIVHFAAGPGGLGCVKMIQLHKALYNSIKQEANDNADDNDDADDEYRAPRHRRQTQEGQASAAAGAEQPPPAQASLPTTPPALASSEYGLFLALAEPYVDQYVKLMKDESVDHARQWWRKHAPKLPMMQRLARRLFAIQATSAEAERVFSVLGLRGAGNANIF
jgi:soluble lytic murein transglycosylase-like protein